MIQWTAMSDLAESFSYMSRFRCLENLECLDVWILGFFIPVLRTFNTLEVQKKALDFPLCLAEHVWQI